MKLCKDCKWYRRSWFESVVMQTDRYDRCVHPDNRNLVTGKYDKFCDMMRSDRWKDLDWSCGPDGRYWEEK
jgi:hypothetical protein